MPGALAKLLAGEKHVGQVGNEGDVISVTLTLDINAYTAGDLIADTQRILDAVRVKGGRALLQSLLVIDEDDQKAAIDIWITSSSATFGSENAAPSITDANARDILGCIAVAAADYKDLGGVSVATKTGIGIYCEAAARTRDLFVAVVSNGSTPTYTASGVKLKFGFLWD